MESNDVPRDGPSFQSDTRIVDKLIEELKSQGMFDQIRRDCLQEVDTKPAYQNLRSRVEDTVSRYMSKQTRNWSPSVNKAQLRTKLRRHIEESRHMEEGVERIVEQVVNPKILSAIQPRVETIICNYLGIDKLEDEEELEITNGQSEDQVPATSGAAGSSSERLSNVSSGEDAQMKSADEVQAKPPASDTSSPGPGLRGDMSPLTPDRLDVKTPTLRGDVSPLTPPPPTTENRPSTPNTPPLPPRANEEREDEEMSPVSDTELVDISPPKQSPETPADSEFPSPPPPPLPQGDDLMMPPLPPPLPTHMPRPPPLPENDTPGPGTPPPLPPSRRPPSPLTSPIGSSSDDMAHPAPKMQAPSSVSASDISETDLPTGSQSESDLEALEAERAKLRAQLEQAKIASDPEEGQAESSEGEVHSSDSGEKKLKETTMETGASPISSTDPSPVPPKEDDHEEEKAKMRVQANPDDSDSEGGSKKSDVSQIPLPKPETASGTKSAETDRASSGSSSKSSKEHHHRSHRRRSHHHKSSKERRSSHSRDRKNDPHRHKDKHHSKDLHDDKKKKDSKEDKKDKEKRKSEKYGKLAEKVNKADTLKSDKFKSFDMFAPKPKKPLSTPVAPRPSSSASSSSTASMGSPTSYGLATPPNFVSKTPPSNVHKSHPKPIPKPASKPVEKILIKQKTEKKKDAVAVQEAKRELKREKKARLELLEPQRKVFPGLPVSKCGEDKLKQHEDDYLQAKRNLQRKREELLQKKELEKLRRRYSSSDSSKRSPDDEGPREPKRKSSLSDKVKRYSDDDSSDDGVKKDDRPKRARKVKKKVDSGNEEESDLLHDNLEKQMEEILGRPDNVEEPEKSQQQIEAQKLLHTDKETKHLIGFDEDDLVGLPKSTLLYDYLLMAEDKLSSVTITDDEVEALNVEVEPSDEYLYLSGLSNALKIVNILKKFGGNPKIVNPLPEWLEEKFCRWKLKRHEVDLIYDPTKVRKRKNIVTEVDYDAKYPVGEIREAKISKVSEAETEGRGEPNAALRKLDLGPPIEGSIAACNVPETLEGCRRSFDDDEEGGFRGFSDQDVRNEPPRVSLTDSEFIDRAGLTFGMLSPPHVGDFDLAPDPATDTTNQHLMSVEMSESLVQHFKRVLDDDTDCLKILSGYAVLKSDDGFVLPPSPISCPSSNGSEQD